LYGVFDETQAGELIQDPAAGTGGFIIAADRYIKQHTDYLFDLSESEQAFQRHQAFYGMELVQDGLFQECVVECSCRYILPQFQKWIFT
jgi:type I restriction-modification system DNA methylase subunit